MVGTLAVCFGIANFFDLDELSMVEGAENEVMIAFGITKVAALAYLAFNLFSPPCFAAIGAMRSEMKSTKWLLGSIGLQLGVGFTAGYLINTVGTLIVDRAALNVTAAIIGATSILLMAVIVALMIRNTNKKLAAERARRTA